MKKIALLTALMIMTAVGIQAQFPGGNAKGQKPPDMGHVYGKVTDSTGAAINGASVLLLQSKYDTVTKKRKEVLLKGVTTKSNGEFSFTDLPMFGQMKLKISATGYKPVEQTVAFQMKMDANAPKPGSSSDPAQAMAAMSNMLNAFDKDLGNIKLNVDAKQLEGVTVIANKPTMKLDIDKKVFNVEKNIVSAGGTAVDVMRNVPSVQVDIDGNVTLRNAAPQLYIDGRPTTLTLDQIPADAIESVEVITNPSAKYDASGGTAGILNIVLKKNKKNGFNGNLRAGVDKRGAMNGGGDFNLRQNKINFSASGMVNQNKSRMTGTTDRVNLYDNPLTTVRQENNNKTSGQFVFGRIGMDYFVTNRTTLSAGAIKVHGEFNPNETIDILTDSIYNTGKISSMSERVSSGTREFNANGLTFGMKHLFPKEGEELTADVNYFSGKNGGNNIYVTNYFDNAGGKIGEHQQQVISDGTNKFLTIQSDYVKPFKKIKLETGVRAQLRKLSNDNQNYILDPNTGEFVLIPSATSNYKNDDNVYAAYVSLTGSKKNFGYKAGLRAESSEYTGVLLNDGSKFSNSYPISLFPSLFLSQKLKNKQELQVSVTRRINRPNFFQLIPYVDYTDNLNITQGNPDLKPEFTSSFELSYAKTFKGNNTFLASAYYKASTDLITRYQTKGPHPITGQEVLINTYINANSSRAYGTEFTSVNTLRKWWDISTNINVYNSEINTDNVSTYSQDAMWSWFGKFNSNFKLPLKFTAQLTATYQSKTNLPVSQGGGFMGPPMGAAQSAAQGYIKSTYGFDVAFKKSFLKNDAASVSFSVNDIFKTRKSEQHSFSQYFIQDYSRQRDPQMFRLNFTYRFGKMDMSLFKRKNMKADMSGATDGMQQ
ncbi:MAG TPA: outer membrane beta-barrel protein [Chitinophagaceae bacterium]|nr:outer membrane beta-barrel protein [Chitinophagaceae bacterium]